LKLGLHYLKYSIPDDPARLAPTLAETAKLADEVGLNSFLPMDHYFTMARRPGSRADGPMLEGYTTLGFVAALTKQLNLGLLVTGVTYRYPGLLAKIVTTLDVLSGGRAILGVGAGWYEREQRGLGVPVVPMAERFERLEETLQICLQMWSDNNGSYEGRHYQLEETLCVPGPLGRRPPIMIGGGGEKKTLLLAARYADACNLMAKDFDATAHKLDVLRMHCDNEGRDYDAIETSTMYGGPIVDNPDEFLAEAQAYAKLGLGELMLIPDRHPVEYVQKLAERIIPGVAEIG
jgi:F420-dependent oxidoreductase-like protein